MGVARQFAQWTSARIARRLLVSIPYVGAVVAVVTLGAAVRKKGLTGGVVDTALNATPYLGAFKNAVEIVKGDLIPDKERAAGARRAGPL
jgi:hypothetical protein